MDRKRKANRARRIHLLKTQIKRCVGKDLHHFIAILERMTAS